MASTRAFSTTATSLALIILINAVFVQSQLRIFGSSPRCTAAAANDALLGQTQLFGNKNTSDSLWNDQLKFFRSYGPISRVTVYKAWDYDGMYHDPGELKGLQFWYGPQAQPPIYNYQDGDANLFGARKPHKPGTFDLAAGEVITRVSLQWDLISMRWIQFWTNTGRSFEWGFKNVPGATTATVSAPVPGAYLAAMRGFEGRPRPVAKKRYIIQAAFVWALPSCLPGGAPPASPVAVPRPPASIEASQRQVSSIYGLDAATVALLPARMEAANIVTTGVTVSLPPPYVEVWVLYNDTTMITLEGRRGAPLPPGAVRASEMMLTGVPTAPGYGVKPKPAASGSRAAAAAAAPRSPAGLRLDAGGSSSSGSTAPEAVVGAGQQPQQDAPGSLTEMQQQQQPLHTGNGAP